MTSNKRMPRNSCTRYQPLIDMMIDGELEHGRASGLQDHMRDCPDCRRVKKDLLSIRSFASSSDEPRLDGDFVARVKETLFDTSYTVESKEVAPLPQVHPRPRRELQLSSIAVYAAMLMIGCFFAFGAYRFGQIHQSQTDEGIEHARLTTRDSHRDERVSEIPIGKSPTAEAEKDLLAEGNEESAAEAARKKRATPFLDSAIKKTQEAIDKAEAAAEIAHSSEEEEDAESELFEDTIPTEEVVLSSMARNVLTSCEQMETIRKEVSARMPTVEGRTLQATPLVMDITETTIDLQQLLKKGRLIPGNKRITAEKMNIVFEIEGNGVHLRIEVDDVANKEPRVNVVDLAKETKKARRRSLAKPAVKRLKLR